MIFKRLFLLLTLLPLLTVAQTSNLWLNYNQLQTPYTFYFSSKNSTFDVIKKELTKVSPTLTVAKKPKKANFIVIDNSQNSAIQLESFVINASDNSVKIEARSSAGALYGVY